MLEIYNEQVFLKEQISLISLYYRVLTYWYISICGTFFSVTFNSHLNNISFFPAISGRSGVGTLSPHPPPPPSIFRLKRKPVAHSVKGLFLTRPPYFFTLHHLHGETGTSGWKIKWFVPFRLGSLRNMGCDLSRCNFSSHFSLFSKFGYTF